MEFSYTEGKTRIHVKYIILGCLGDMGILGCHSVTFYIIIIAHNTKLVLRVNINLHVVAIIYTFVRLQKQHMRVKSQL